MRSRNPMHATTLHQHHEHFVQLACTRASECGGVERATNCSVDTPCTRAEMRLEGWGRRLTLRQSGSVVYTTWASQLQCLHNLRPSRNAGMGSPTHAEAVLLGRVHDLGQPAPHLLEHFLVLGCLPLEHDRQHVNLHTCARANIQFG